MKFIPKNEQGVIFLFANFISGHEDIELIKIGMGFPDAEIRIHQNGNWEDYSVEFEFVASSFNKHGHDVRQCDLVICWENDLVESDLFPLPIIELKSGLELDIKKPNKLVKEVYYWRQRAVKAEKEICRLEQLGNVCDQPRSKEQSNEDKVNRGEARQVALDALLVVYQNNPDLSYAEAGRQVGRSKSWVAGALVELESTGRIHRNGDGVKIVEVA